MKTHTKTTLMIFLVTLVALGIQATAQEALVTSEATLDLVQAEGGTNAVGGEDLIDYTPDESTLDAAVQVQQNKFSISLDEVPLDDVVKMFTKIAPDVNLIVSASNLYDKTVTVNLKNVEWQPALSSILQTHQMQLVEQSPGVFTVMEVGPETVNFITKPFTLNYTTVGDLAPVVQAMLPLEPLGATLTQFASRNILVVRSTVDNLTQIEGIIKEIDKPSKQVVIETKFMELTDEASTQLGIKWSSLEQFGVTLGAGPFTRSETTGRTITRDDATARWDGRRQTDATFLSYDNFNIPYASGTPTPTTVAATPNTPGGTVPTAGEATRTTYDSIDIGQDYSLNTLDSFVQNIQESQASIIDVDDLNLIISALKRTDGVSIISNPKIIVTSGYTGAVFRVGRSEPIIKTEITRGTADSPGDIVTASLDTQVNTDYIKQGFMNTGIELRVVPTVKTDDLIEATIYPVLTRKETDKTVGNNSWPIISVKQISTKFTLRSGQTVAIGGLTDSRDQKKVTKIPLLGDIPIIGRYLFTHTEDVTRQIETVIFVSLALAEPQDLSEDAGIPEDAYLTYNKRLQMDVARRRRAAGREQLRESLEAELQDEANKLKSHLMQRDK